MDPRLPAEIAALGATARRALADPGLDRARVALAGDDDARGAVADVLARLGLHDLDPCDHPQALAGAHLALESGRVGNLVPVAAVLAAAAAGRAGRVQAVPATGAVVLVEHHDPGPVAGVTLDGRVVALEAVDGEHHSVMAPFVAVTRRGVAVDDGRAWCWALYETVTAFTSLGAVEAACELARDHLQARHQFGKPLAAQQSLQHRYADMLLTAASLSELAHHTLWKLFAAPDKAVLDALALRVQHLESVRTAFRHAHQIHAAVGFCAEHPLSACSRAVRFGQHVPLSYDETLDAIVDHLPLGFDALFPVHPFRAPG